MLKSLLICTKLSMIVTLIWLERAFGQLKLEEVQLTDWLKLLEYQVIRLWDVHFNEINLLVYAILSEWFEFLNLNLFLDFPLRFRPMRIMVTNHYCHVFPFVMWCSPTDSLNVLVLMVKRWLMILLQRSHYPKCIA